ncbi:pseudouridylate synthase [Thermoflexales bacterium]|nr:pseudouridylate synthase [Thermoflexales bacterium]
MPVSLHLSSPVRAALDQHQPIVALESTLITHGLPRPVNLEVARRLEALVRETGATPATIAILAGELYAGLEPDQLERLANTDNVRKVSRRDLPIVTAQQGHGATTVAATMWVAAQAGIKVFATGGIGGVHRGQPFDVSADLPELAQTSVVVVCAGAKAILDLPLTLEWLETHGVPVLGFGTDTFPAFYSRSSSLPVDARCNTAEEAARIIRAKFELGLPGGVLIGVPIPEEYAVANEDIEPAILQALKMAEAENVRGKAMTPFLLKHVSELTAGESQKANIALLENNARVAAQIARALTT